MAWSVFLLKHLFLVSTSKAKAVLEIFPCLSLWSAVGTNRERYLQLSLNISNEITVNISYISYLSQYIYLIYINCQFSFIPLMSNVTRGILSRPELPPVRARSGFNL